MNSIQTGSTRKKRTRIGWLSLLSHPAEISGVQVKSLVTPALAGKNPVPHGLLRMRSMQGRYMGLVGQRPKRKVIRLKLKEWLAFKAGYDPGQMRDAHGRWTSGLSGGGPVDRNTHFGRPLDMPDAAVESFIAGKMSPLELDKLIRPLPWGPKQQLARKAIQIGARAIDKVLSIPPQYLRTKGKDSLVVLLRDRYYAWGVFDSQNVKMSIETIGSNKQASTFVHEFGHFLETIPIIHAAFLHTGPAEGPLTNWVFAVLASPELKAMRELISSGFVNTLTGKRIWLGKARVYLRYLNEPSEVWARSFTQYIATRSGNKSLLRELKSSTHRIPRYWTPENFVPIGRALDNIFNVAGFLPPPEGKAWVGFKAGYNPGQVRDSHGRWTSGSAAVSTATKPSGSKWRKVAAGLAGGGVAAGVLVATAVHFRKQQAKQAAHRQAWEWAKTDTYTGTPAHAQDMRNHPKPDTRDQIQEARQRLAKLKNQIKSRRFRKLWYSKIVREERHDTDSATMWNRAMGGTYGGVFGGYLPPRFPRLGGRPNYPRLSPPSTKAYNPNQQRDYHGRWGIGGVQLTGRNRFRARKALHALPGKAMSAVGHAIDKPINAALKPLPVPAKILAHLFYGHLKGMLHKSGLQSAVRRNLSTTPAGRRARLNYGKPVAKKPRFKAGYSASQPRDSRGRWGNSGRIAAFSKKYRKVAGTTGLAVAGGASAIMLLRYLRQKRADAWAQKLADAASIGKNIQGWLNMREHPANKRNGGKFPWEIAADRRYAVQPYNPGPRSIIPYTGKERFKAGFHTDQLRDEHGRWASGGGFSIFRIGANRHITGVIRELHHLGGSRPLPAVSYHITGHLRLNKLPVEGIYDGQHIYVSNKTDTPGLTTAHEVGHMLDHRGLDTLWASANSPELAGWRNAVDSSAKVRQIRTWRALGYIAIGGTRYYPKSDEVYKYFLNRREQWARSVAQWHAIRSGNGRTLRELRIAQRGLLPYYWSNRDFRPIYAEVDRVMRQHGYTSSSTHKEAFKAGYNPGEPRDSHGRWSVSGRVEDVVNNLNSLGGKKPLPDVEIILTPNAPDRFDGSYAGNATIYISLKTKIPGLITAHELGHVLEVEKGGLGSIDDKKFDTFRKAVNESELIARAQEWKKNGFIVVNGARYYTKTSSADYFLDPHETWARAFAQWYVQRSGDVAARQELNLMREGPLPYYWSDSDFQPIYDIVDELMRQEGYAK